MDIKSLQKHLKPDVFKGYKQYFVLDKPRVFQISLWAGSLEQITSW